MLNGTTVIESARELIIPEIRVVKADNSAILAHWPFLRAKMLEIKKKYSRRAKHVPIRWEPEQFRYNLLQPNTNMELFLCLGPDEERKEIIKGFFISTISADYALHVPLDFFLWIGWAGYPLVLESSMLQIDEMARARGCTGIEHMSTFLGWGRRQQKMMERLREQHGLAAGSDWKMKYVVWRRSLVPDREG